MVCKSPVPDRAEGLHGMSDDSLLNAWPFQDIPGITDWCTALRRDCNPNMFTTVQFHHMQSTACCELAQQLAYSPGRALTSLYLVCANASHFSLGQCYMCELVADRDVCIHGVVDDSLEGCQWLALPYFLRLLEDDLTHNSLDLTLCIATQETVVTLVTLYNHAFWLRHVHIFGNRYDSSCPALAFAVCFWDCVHSFATHWQSTHDLHWRALWDRLAQWHGNVDDSLDGTCQTDMVALSPMDVALDWTYLVFHAHWGVDETWLYGTFPQLFVHPDIGWDSWIWLTLLWCLHKLGWTKLTFLDCFHTLSSTLVWPGSWGHDTSTRDMHYLALLHCCQVCWTAVDVVWDYLHCDTMHYSVSNVNNVDFSLPPVGACMPGSPDVDVVLGKVDDSDCMRVVSTFQDFTLSAGTIILWDVHSTPGTSCDYI